MSDGECGLPVWASEADHVQGCQVMSGGHGRSQHGRRAY